MSSAVLTPAARFKTRTKPDLPEPFSPKMTVTPGAKSICDAGFKRVDAVANLQRIYADGFERISIKLLFLDLRNGLERLVRELLLRQQQFQITVDVEVSRLDPVLENIARNCARPSVLVIGPPWQERMRRLGLSLLLIRHVCFVAPRV